MLERLYQTHIVTMLEWKKDLVKVFKRTHYYPRILVVAECRWSTHKRKITCVKNVKLYRYYDK